jgi:MscS family membrane protein
MKWKLESIFKIFVCLLFAALLWSIWASAQNAPGQTTIEFAQAQYSTREGARFASVTIKRSGTNSPVTVRLATADDTAAAGVDYVGTNGIITLAADQTETAARISLIDDQARNGTRVLKLSLSEPTGAVLGALTSAELTIIDNDTAASVWLTFGLDRVPFLRRSVIEIPLWQYLASLGYIFLAFYFSRLLDFVVRGQLRRWSAKTKTQLDDLLLELLRSPLKVIVFVVLLHLGLKIFSWPEWFADFFSKALKIVVACSITYMVLKVVDVLLGYWKQRRTSDEDRSFNEQLLPIIRNTLKVFIVVIAVLVTLQNLGLNVTSLIASLSIGGLALSLAAQDTLSNLFGAVAVLTDKPFHVGDNIKIDGVEGSVEAIGLRSTRVRNLDGFLVSVPNKTMGNATITNLSLRPNIKTVINIGLTYDTPSGKVKHAAALLEEIFRNHPMTHDVLVGFNRFADSALNIQVVHWWKGTNNKAYVAGLQELNLTVKQRFDAEGLQFAFPSSTVYVKQDATPRPAT